MMPLYQDIGFFILGVIALRYNCDGLLIGPSAFIVFGTIFEIGEHCGFWE